LHTRQVSVSTIMYDVSDVLSGSSWYLIFENCPLEGIDRNEHI
jgi:hypothetical protein